jgi:hypothetical protein
MSSGLFLQFLKLKIKRCVEISANKVVKLTEFIQNEINKSNTDSKAYSSVKNSKMNEKMTY